MNKRGNSRQAELPQGGLLPPQALNIEEAVLGAAMLERDACLALQGAVKTEEMFYSEFHRAVYRAIVACHASGLAVDMITVLDQMEKVAPAFMKEKRGETAYRIASLTGGVNSGANLETHLAILKQKYLRRTVIKGASALQAKAYDETVDEFELVNENQLLLNTAFETVSSKRERSAKEIYLATFEQMMAACDAKGLTGVPTGIKPIDSLTGGWQKGELIILAARPAMGKTALALAFGKNAAVDYERRVAVFSLEMNAESLMRRMIAAESGYTNSELARGLISGGKATLGTQVATMSAKLGLMPMAIDDSRGLTIGELRAKALRMAAKDKLELVIVDYLQLMSGESRGGNREQEISNISRGLKKLAGELDVPVIALSQLSRAVEARADKRPMLSDLRESGAIEQDADQVIFLYRPEYYGIAEDELGQSTAGVLEVIWAKYRNGATVTKVLKADLKHNRFTGLDDFEAQPGQGPPDFARNRMPESDFESEPNPF